MIGSGWSANLVGIIVAIVMLLYVILLKLIVIPVSSSVCVVRS